jgi:L-rhamnose mutarotase
MKKMAFKMHLHKGYEDEYKKRHDEIPSELKFLLKGAGIADYSIFLDRSTGDLFGVMNVDNEEKLLDLSTHPIMKKWWTFMKDIMDANEDHSPVTVPLTEVFYLK